MHDEDLDISEAERIAQDNGATFEATVRDLQPPAELEDGHEGLLQRGDAAPPTGDDPTALRRWLLGFADIYRDLGAQGCEQRQRQIARQVPQGS